MIDPTLLTLLSSLFVGSNPWLLAVGAVALFLLQKAGGGKFDFSGLLARLKDVFKPKPVAPVPPPLDLPDEDDFFETHPALKALRDALLARLKQKFLEAQTKAHDEVLDSFLPAEEVAELKGE
jgi:hypothetical protein